MDPAVRRFLRASLAWLVVGVALGTAMAVRPALVGYRPAHLHAMLLGFVTMMIAGVAYHVIPRFVGAPLHAPWAPRAHFAVANAGLAAMVAAFLLRAHGVIWSAPLLGTGAALSASGLLLFAWNLWCTLGRSPQPIQVPMRAPVPRPAER